MCTVFTRLTVDLPQRFRDFVMFARLVFEDLVETLQGVGLVETLPSVSRRRTSVDALNFRNLVLQRPYLCLLHVGFLGALVHKLEKLVALIFTVDELLDQFVDVLHARCVLDPQECCLVPAHTEEESSKRRR